MKVTGIRSLKVMNTCSQTLISDRQLKIFLITSNN